MLEAKVSMPQVGWGLNGKKRRDILKKLTKQYHIFQMLTLRRNYHNAGGDILPRWRKILRVESTLIKLKVFFETVANFRTSNPERLEPIKERSAERQQKGSRPRANLGGRVEFR